MFNIYSPVGAILTGEHATASVVQNLGRAERAGIAEALERFRGEVAAQDAIPEPMRGEVLDLLAEGQAELGRDRPNALRVSSVLTGIAGVVQTLGALQPAYQVLKTTAASFGVTLP